MNFNPIFFVDNLTYMASGMLGIIVVIGIIILITVLLNKASSNIKECKQDRQEK